MSSNQFSGERRLTKSLIEQQRKERAEAVSETHNSDQLIASTSDSLYRRNTERNSAIEQQLGVNDDSESHDILELRRQVVEARASKEAREKRFLLKKLRQYEDENRNYSDSLNVMPIKNGGRVNNVARMSTLEKPFARGQPYQEEQVAQYHLRRVRDHTLVFRDIKPAVSRYFT